MYHDNQALDDPWITKITSKTSRSTKERNQEPRKAENLQEPLAPREPQDQGNQIITRNTETRKSCTAIKVLSVLIPGISEPSTPNVDYMYMYVTINGMNK